MSKLLEINPKELKFTVELKRQSACTIKLTNVTNYYVAFKVKTTSPKKYCVRPNVGIVLPNSSCDFTVVMQVPRGPLDLECKDKFLIQSTTVSTETTDEDITASMFVRDSGNYVEERKLKVILVGPPDSPTLSPINGALSPRLGREASFFREESVNGFETLSKPQKVIEEKEEPVRVNAKEPQTPTDQKNKPGKTVLFKLANDVDELKPVNGVEELKKSKYIEESNPVVEIEELKPVTEVEESSQLKYVKELKPVIDLEELNQERNVEELNPTTAREASKPEIKIPESNPAIDREVLKPAINTEETKPAIDEGSKTVRDVELKQENALELKTTECVIEDSRLIKDIQEIKSKLSEFELKFSKAEFTISKLMVERNSNIDDRKILHDKLTELSKREVKTVQVGFPLLFVCMVALISVVIGYRLHP